MPATAPDAHGSIDAVWRIESPRLIAGLTRITGDVGLAEDLAQDALVAALERWPESGVPDNPAAWLMATAKHRAIDQLRRGKMLDRKHEQLGHELEAQRDAGLADLDAAIDDHIGDDLLRLMFIACHPVLSTEARVALTLRLLGGLTTDEIARAFLVPESTVAQRIVRAKRTLREARVPFEVPRGAELTARLSSVLEVIYLVFNEGYSATAGEEWVRPALCDDALRLGRILAELVPEEPEVHGLVALLEIQASRLHARVGPGGQPVPLADQDRTHWDPLLIRRGCAAISWPSSAASTKHGPSSSAPQRSRATHASATCSAPARPGARGESPDAPYPDQWQDLLRRDSRARHPSFRRVLRQGVRLGRPAARRRSGRLRRRHGRGERRVGGRPAGVAAAGPAHLHHGGQRRGHNRRGRGARRRAGAADRERRARDHRTGPRSRGERHRPVPGTRPLNRRRDDRSSRRRHVRAVPPVLRPPPRRQGRGSALRRRERG